MLNFKQWFLQIKYNQNIGVTHLEFSLQKKFYVHHYECTITDLYRASFEYLFTQDWWTRSANAACVIRAAIYWIADNSSPITSLISIQATKPNQPNQTRTSAAPSASSNQNYRILLPNGNFLPLMNCDHNYAMLIPQVKWIILNFLKGCFSRRKSRDLLEK